MKTRKPFLLRIGPALYRELEEWAHEEFRSVNGQIEFLLRQAVNKRKGDRDKDPGEGGTAAKEPENP